MSRDRDYFRCLESDDSDPYGDRIECSCCKSRTLTAAKVHDHKGILMNDHQCTDCSDTCTGCNMRYPNGLLLQEKDDKGREYGVAWCPLCLVEVLADNDWKPEETELAAQWLAKITEAE